MPAPLTGRKVLAIFVAFFTTIASANAVLVTSALRTWSGLEDPSPYQASQRYNAELERARAQDALGWHLVAGASRHPDGDTALVVTLTDRNGTPLPGRTLRARLERPTHKQEDRTLALSEEGRGRYGARAAALPAGQWEFVIEVVGEDGIAFRRKHRIVLD